MNSLPEDRKYFGTVRKISDQTTIDDGIVFRMKDNAFAFTLPTYRAMCASLGASPKQLAEIDALIVRIHAWRDANVERCKVPD